MQQPTNTTQFELFKNGLNDSSLTALRGDLISFLNAKVTELADHTIEYLKSFPTHTSPVEQTANKKININDLIIDTSGVVTVDMLIRAQQNLADELKITPHELKKYYRESDVFFICNKAIKHESQVILKCAINACQVALLLLLGYPRKKLPMLLRISKGVVNTSIVRVFGSSSTGGAPEKLTIPDTVVKIESLKKSYYTPTNNFDKPVVKNNIHEIPNPATILNGLTVDGARLISYNNNLLLEKCNKLRAEANLLSPEMFDKKTKSCILDGNVIKLYMCGKGNTEICKELNAPPSTVSGITSKYFNKTVSCARVS